MKRAPLAGAHYFAPVFAAGFALGAIRTVLVAPALGEPAAVLVELPFMLLVAWIACLWTTRRLAVPGRTSDRLVMGASALALLLMAEAAISVVLFGRSPTEHLALYLEPATRLGLIGQLAFAAFPLIQSSAPRR